MPDSENTPNTRELLVAMSHAQHLMREEQHQMRGEFADWREAADRKEARDDERSARTDERLSDYEGRTIVIERSLDGVARRSDIENLQKSLLEGTREDMAAVRQIGSIRDRVGTLEGKSSAENNRHASRGAIGGIGVTVIVALALVILRLLGVEIPTP